RQRADSFSNNGQCVPRSGSGVPCVAGNDGLSAETAPPGIVLAASVPADVVLMKSRRVMNVVLPPKSPYRIPSGRYYSENVCDCQSRGLRLDESSLPGSRIAEGIGDTGGNCYRSCVT